VKTFRKQKRTKILSNYQDHIAKSVPSLLFLPSSCLHSPEVTAFRRKVAAFRQKSPLFGESRRFRKVAAFHQKSPHFSGSRRFSPKIAAFRQKSAKSSRKWPLFDKSHRKSPKSRRFSLEVAAFRRSHRFLQEVTFFRQKSPLFAGSPFCSRMSIYDDDTPLQML